MAVAAEAAKPTILVAEKLGKGGVDMLKEVRLGAVALGRCGCCEPPPPRLPRPPGLGLHPSPCPYDALPRALSRQVGTVDCSYEMSKEELLAKISLCDAIVIRSATKARPGVLSRWTQQGSAALARR